MNVSAGSVFFFFAESFEYAVEYGGPKNQNWTLPEVATAHVGIFSD